MVSRRMICRPIRSRGGVPSATCGLKKSRKRSSKTGNVTALPILESSFLWFPITRSRTMRRVFVAAVFGLVLLAGSLLAFEVGGTIKKVDGDKGVLYVHANGQDREVKIA